MFAFHDVRGSVEVAFTDRYLADRASGTLDLAEPKPGDDPGAWNTLAERIEAVAHALARDGEAPGESPGGHPGERMPGEPSPVVVRMRQVHAADVLTVDRSWLEVRHPEPPEVDGLVTDLPGVALLVRAADCVPVLLADADRGVLGAAHAGRLGLVQGVVPAAVARMRDLGAERIVAWVGPHVCGHCYEVPSAMREEVAAVVPEAFAETSWGTPAVDVGAGILAQLHAQDVEVVDASSCTLEDANLHSYRRDGEAAGRIGGLVWVRP